MIEDFYPTPERLIGKMLEGVNFELLSFVLEPSAGKGDICDYVKQMSRYNRTPDIDVIENNPDLQHILKGKEYRLVHNDFLTFNTRRNYDLIIANFPFSDGDRHLQKALSLIEQNGGNLVCLVNAETVRNTFTQLRQQLLTKLERMNATIEYLPDEFLTAERKTGVEIALIKFAVVRDDFPSVILDGMRRSQPVEAEEQADTSLVGGNFFNKIVTNFNAECELGVRFIKEYYGLKPYIKDRLTKPGKTDYSKPIIDLRIGDSSSHDSLSGRINKYLEAVRGKYWAVLVEDERFYTKYTSNILKQLTAKLVELKHYDFTLFNISELEKDLSAKINLGIEDSIIKIFDEFSRFSHYYGCTNNIHYYSGWKTNKAHKINGKIIIPVNGFCAYSSKKKLDTYYLNERLSDMIKVFNYLAAEDSSRVTQLVGWRLEEANETGCFTNIDFRYFETTFYKKGTCHIRFKNQKLLDKLNIYGSQRKGWLPPCYGKKPYQDMEADEKAVIDDFQGQEKYEEVMKDSDFFLVQNQTLQLAAGF